MKTKLLFILFVGFSVFLLGCNKTLSGNSQISGNAVADAESGEKATVEEQANAYNCEDKKKLLEDEVRALESDLTSTEKDIREKVTNLQRTQNTGTDEEKKAATDSIKELNTNAKTIRGQLDTLKELVEAMTCP